MGALKVEEYKNHLFDETTDGYVQIIRFKDNKIIEIYNTKLDGIQNIINDLDGVEDAFITPNTMYKPFRRVENIRQFRSLYIDLDKCKKEELLTLSYTVIELGKDEVIPEPTMIVVSGRGIHIYWRIEDAPYQALNTWQELEDFLYYKLKKYGADKKATDGARVLRLPGTINSKNNEVCRIIYVNEEIKYSMYDLREKYLDHGIRSKQLKFNETKKQCNVVPNKFFNSYSLHITRAEDLLTLCKLRHYRVTGYRNMIIHCYAYWKGIYIRDIKQLENEAIKLNGRFTEPLKESEIRAIIRCVPKAIDKFIAYEQGIRCGERKRVSKGMHDKGGYWYKNETLIERLDITKEEQRELKTIIGKEEKYRRNNLRRTPRNEDGLTPREQQKKDLINKIKNLKLQGLKQKDIAEKLGISKGTVSKYLKL